MEAPAAAIPLAEERPAVQLVQILFLVLLPQLVGEMVVKIIQLEGMAVLVVVVEMLLGQKRVAQAQADKELMVVMGQLQQGLVVMAGLVEVQQERVLMVLRLAAGKLVEQVQQIVFPAHP